jgi:alpha-L-rhamnosidase
MPPQILTSITELWDYYLQSGDASALNGTTYQAVKRYMSLWTLDSQGLVNHRPGDWDWHDWGANIDARVLDNAWYYMALDSTINLANLTGNGADVAGWQSKRNSIAANFNAVLWNNTSHEYRSPGYPGLRMTAPMPWRW